MDMNTAERYRGAMLGLAVGDALGTTLEFSPPGSFAPIDDIIGGGPFQLAPGAWTDDTSMALCLAESLIECGGFDAADQMRRYVRWYREGHMSSTGRCFDIGNTTRAALQRFEDTGNPWCGSKDPRTAGNGSIMRLAPVVLAFAPLPSEAVAMAARSSHTTHGARDAVDGCRYLAALLLGALGGASKEDLLGPPSQPAGHPRDRSRGALARSGAVGVPSRRILPRWGVTRRQPRRGRRYDRRRLRPARGRILRGNRDPGLRQGKPKIPAP